MAKAKGLPSAQTLMFAFLMSLPSVSDGSESETTTNNNKYFTPLSGTTDAKHSKLVRAAGAPLIFDRKPLTHTRARPAFFLPSLYIRRSKTNNAVAEDVAVMERIEGGEVFFRNEDELREFAQILGMPDL